jgi:hypothetical protein
MNTLTRFLGFTRFTLVTHLSPDECVARLKDTVDPPWNIGGMNEAIGTVGRTFRIRRHIAYRNAWLTFLVGRIEDSDVGTRIRCHTRWAIFVILFCTV